MTSDDATRDRLRLALSDRMDEPEDCHSCKGTGEGGVGPAYRCWHCNGTGVEP